QASQVRECTKITGHTDISSVRHADSLSAGSSFSQRSATALAPQAESLCSRNFAWRSESHSQDCPSFPILRSRSLLMKDIAPAIFAPNGIGDAKPDNQAVLDWVHEIGTLTNPENIFWCDGSDRENEFLVAESLKQNVLIKLNETKVPRSYLHRSNPNDVARVEQFTFICTPTKEEAGPTNNWAEPAETYSKLRGLLKGAMRGRTMFVVPYIMGPPDSSLTKVGFEITDSKYVVLSMRIMTRMGEVAL